MLEGFGKANPETDEAKGGEKWGKGEGKGWWISSEKGVSPP